MNTNRMLPPLKPLWHSQPRDKKYEHGHRVGRHWARRWASLEQIQRLVVFVGREPDRFVKRLRTSEVVKLASELFLVLTDTTVADEMCTRPFWEIAFSEPNEIHDSDIVSGFVQGAIKGWTEIRDELGV